MRFLLYLSHSLLLSFYFVSNPQGVYSDVYSGVYSDGRGCGESGKREMAGGRGRKRHNGRTRLDFCTIAFIASAPGEV